MTQTNRKIAAQCCHGCLGSFQVAMEMCPDVVRQWESTGCAKVVLKTNDPEELYRLQATCEGKNIPCYLVHDAGRTQIPSGSMTVLGMGPAKVEEIDAIAHHLKLL